MGTVEFGRVAGMHLDPEELAGLNELLDEADTDT